MWSKDKSLALSQILVWVLFILIPVLCFCVPTMVHWYDIVYSEGVGLVKGSVYFPLSITLYISAVFGEICLYHLMKLLNNIKKEVVFVAENCGHLRMISWCCLLVAIPFTFMGFWRFLSFIVALAALFFGVILRVLKNVFDKAVILQEENDYTI